MDVFCKIRGLLMKEEEIKKRVELSDKLTEEVILVESGLISIKADMVAYARLVLEKAPEEKRDELIDLVRIQSTIILQEYGGLVSMLREIAITDLITRMVL